MSCSLLRCPAPFPYLASWSRRTIAETEVSTKPKRHALSAARSCEGRIQHISSPDFAPEPHACAHDNTTTQQDLVSVNTVLLFHVVGDSEQQTKLSAKDFGDRKIIIVEDLIT
jgi:hypothetical protein